MDDMDGSTNQNAASGWIGRIESNSNTTFRFCRVPGNQFHPRIASDSSGNYGVVRMGRSCPNNSSPLQLYWDNEDTNNTNGSSGHVAPSLLTANTWLELCVFSASTTAPNVGFPTTRMPAGYGVFGTNSVPGVLATGSVRADGDHNDNQNAITGSVSAPFVFRRAHYIGLYTARVR